MPTYGLYLSTLVHEFIGIYVRKLRFLFIRRCYEASRKGFVFNLLKGNDTSTHFNYFLPHEIEEHVSDFAHEVIIKEGYMEGDFTVFLKKESK